jgi:hypothetical protein
MEKSSVNGFREKSSVAGLGISAPDPGGVIRFSCLETSVMPVCAVLADMNGSDTPFRDGPVGSVCGSEAGSAGREDPGTVDVGVGSVAADAEGGALLCWPCSLTDTSQWCDSGSMS